MLNSCLLTKVLLILSLLDSGLYGQVLCKLHLHLCLCFCLSLSTNHFFAFGGKGILRRNPSNQLSVEQTLELTHAQYRLTPGLIDISCGATDALYTVALHGGIF